MDDRRKTLNDRRGPSAAPRAQTRRSLAALLSVLLAGAVAPARAAEPLPPAPLEDVADFRLDNGLEVVVIPDHRAPVVTHMIWYKVGSADEPRGTSGIAHFLEHLMFKGTREHPQGAFSAAVQSIGGNENAFTTADYTAFFQTVTPAALPTMMAFEADRMRNLVLTDAVVNPERDVILEERRMRVDNSPDALLSEEVQATLFQNHPYRIPVIGWEQEMEKLTRTDAEAFYKRFYAPNNAVLVVAGDASVADVKRMAEATYGRLSPNPDLTPRKRPQEPEQNAARTVTLRDGRVSVPGYSKNWVVPSYESAAPGEAEALDLLSEVLGGGVQSRIYQTLVVRDGLASAAGAYYDGSDVDATSFSVYGSPQGAHTLDEVERAVDAEISRVATSGVSDDELTKAKNRYVRAMVFARDSASGMAQIYGETLATGGTVADVQGYAARIQAVTAEQVQAAAVRYLVPSRAVTGYLLPEDAASAADANGAQAPSEPLAPGAAATGGAPGGGAQQ